ncbi:MAG: ComF family protein [Candidatus Coatesbacteria bacterium]|nr:MAG: ComF family protein [Candidatus Coatesbacteria bacterium]
MAGVKLDLVRELASGLESLLFPSACRACGADLAGARLICRRCRDYLTAPLPETWRRRCDLGEEAVGRWARHPYEGPAGEALRLLKFGGKRRMAALLAAGLAPLVQVLKAATGVEAAVPVPLHPARRRERRFNQSEDIGRRVATAVGIEFKPRGLARLKYTRPQVELDGEARRANVRGAFAAREDFSGRTVLVVDDVITTGATVAECARVLCETGATTVVAVAVAGAGLTEASEQ